MSAAPRLPPPALKRFGSFGGSDEYLICLQHLPLVVFLASFHLRHQILFLALGFGFLYPALWASLTLVCLSPALCADEQHPADEGAVGEDV